MFGRAVTTAREALGEDAYAAAQEAGSLLGVEAVTAEVERVLAAAEAATASTPRPPASAYGLTSREVQVLRLAANGKSNAEITEALFISPRTAQTPVTNLLAKLDVSSRTAAVGLALRDRPV